MQTATFRTRTACISCEGSNLLEIASGTFEEGIVKRIIDRDPWGEHPGPFLKGNHWSFVECTNCGQKFHRNILSPKWKARKLAKWATPEAIEEFEARIRTPETEFNNAHANVTHAFQLEKITRNIRGDSPIKILDFGCGNSKFLSMCSLFGFEAYGVGHEMPQAKSSDNIKVSPEIKDIANLAPFHVVTLFQSLETLDNPHETISALSELLVKDGILILEVADCTGVTDIKKINDYRKIDPLRNINAYTTTSLVSFAKRLGFKRIELPMTCIASGRIKIIRKLARNFLRPVMKDYTRMYFQKL